MYKIIVDIPFPYTLITKLTTNIHCVLSVSHKFWNGSNLCCHSNLWSHYDVSSLHCPFGIVDLTVLFKISKHLEFYNIFPIKKSPRKMSYQCDCDVPEVKK